MTAIETIERFDHNMEELKWMVRMLLDKNKELQTRNDELEKENKKLRETISELSKK